MVNDVFFLLSMMLFISKTKTHLVSSRRLRGGQYIFFVKVRECYSEHGKRKGISGVRYTVKREGVLRVERITQEKIKVEQTKLGGGVLGAS